MSIPFLSGQLWKVATGGAAVVALVLTVLLMSSYVDNRSIVSQRDVLTQRINDPKTGYVVQLAQARTNEETLKLVVETQTKQLKALDAESKAQLAQSEQRLAVAQAATKAAEIKLHNFLATKPQGSTLEDRVRDIDSRALEELIP